VILKLTNRIDSNNNNKMNAIQIFDILVNPIIALIALILSLIMIYVFSNKQFKECSYKYLKVQSIFFANL
jgi:hypothetical protein